MSVLTRGGKRKQELEEGTIASRLKKRGKRGLAGVISWNMQGGGGNVQKPQVVRGWMDEDEIQVICLQECSGLYNWANGGNVNLPGNWTVGFYQEWNAGGNNNRCSLGILTRGAPLLRKSFGAISLTQRPLAGVKVFGNYWVWTLHAPANPNGAGDQAYIQACLQTARSWSGVSWMCAGDYNMDLLANNPINGFTVVNSGAITRGQREYDYAYVGGRWAGTWAADVITTPGNESDHGAVRFDLDED